MLIVYLIENGKTGVDIFIKIENVERWKKVFSVNSFQKILIFYIYAFSKNVQCFVILFC